MQLVADILLGSGALAAAAYCLVLSRRLKRFTQLESGMGSAIAVLSAQVDDMTRALARAQEAATASATKLEAERLLAERAAQRIELLVAALHDLPQGTASAAPEGSGGQAGGPAPGHDTAPAADRAGQPGPARGDPPRTLAGPPVRPDGPAAGGAPPPGASAADARPSGDVERRARFVRHRVSRTGLEAAE